MLFGYAHADLVSSGKNTQIETDSLFLGLYGQDTWQGIDIGLSLNLGYEDHDSSRALLNQGQAQVAQGSYSSLFLSPALRLSHRAVLSEHWELRPAASVSYTQGWYKGYTERGAEGLSDHAASGRANITQNKREGLPPRKRGKELEHPPGTGAGLSLRGRPRRSGLPKWPRQPFHRP